MKIENIEADYLNAISRIDEQLKWLDYFWEKDLNTELANKFTHPNISKASFLVNHSMMLIVYCASVFESLTGDIINLLILKSIKGLRDSDKKLSYKEIFKFQSIEELQDAVIQKRINDIKYKSIGNQMSELKNKYGFEPKLTESELSGLVDLFECRNIILHNRGVINDVYVERTGKLQHLKGDKYPFNEDYLSECSLLLATIGRKMIRTAKNKYTS